MQTGATVLPVDAWPYRFLDSWLSLAAKTELFERGYQAVRRCSWGGHPEATRKQCAVRK